MGSPLIVVVVLATLVLLVPTLTIVFVPTVYGANLLTHQIASPFEEQGLGVGAPGVRPSFTR